MEARGVVSVHVCTTNYVPVALSVAKGTGHPDHPIIVLPESTNAMSSEELDKCAEFILRETGWGVASE